MADIVLNVESRYFIYGVSAIILHNDNVLMAKNDNYPYYYLIGGKVLFGEASESAVLREVHDDIKNIKSYNVDANDERESLHCCLSINCRSITCFLSFLSQS